MAASGTLAGSSTWTGSLFSQLDSKRVAVTAVFILSVLVSLGFYLIVPSGLENDPKTDFATYYEPVARNLLAGRGYIQHVGEPNVSARYPPGFSLQIAASLWIANLLHIPERISLLIAAIVGMGLTSVLVFMFARSVWNVRFALLAASVWMTYPLALWLVNGQNGEVPFQAALYTGLYTLWRAVVRKSASPIAYFLAGMLGGAAMLIRPIAIGIGLIMAAVIWFGGREFAVRRRLVLVTVLMLGNLAAIAPWEAFVYARTGKVVMLGTGGVVSLRDGLTFAINTKGYRQGVSVPGDVEELMRDVLANYEQLQTVGDVGLIVGHELRERPVAVAKLFVIKAARSWYGTDTHRREPQVLLMQLIYLVFIALGSVAAWKAGGLSRRLVVMVWLVTCYFWGMNILSTGLARYTVPIMGLLFLLVPAALNRRAVVVEAPSGWSTTKPPGD